MQGGNSRREWLLLIASVGVSLAVALALIRLLAPGLLGQPVDLRVVQVDERVAPFFENLFRPEDYASEQHLLNDPFTSVRARPMAPVGRGTGPTDLLGFRNHGIPNRAGIVAIGDSQTYGTNVPIDAAWPQQLGTALGEGSPAVYSMAVGGWGAVQYLDMFTKARAFRPRVAVIAFYSGNDSRESFRLAYSVEHWAFLRPDPGLDTDDLPRVAFPVPREEYWRAQLSDGTWVSFTPGLRLASNVHHPGVAAGWAIMADVASRILATAQTYRQRVVFAIVPTKELAFEKRLRRAGVYFDAVYAELVEVERRNIARLTERIGAEGGVVVDLLGPLERAVLEDLPIYREGIDGHPRTRGHRVIAEALAPAVRSALSAKP